MYIFDEYKPRPLESIADSYRNNLKISKEDLIKLEKKHRETRKNISDEERELANIHRDFLHTIEDDLMTYDEKNKLHDLTKERLELSIEYFNKLIEMLEYTYSSKLATKYRIQFIQNLLLTLELNNHIKYT